MVDKVKKEKVFWFSILSRLDEGKFLPGYNCYLRRIQKRNKYMSQNRICYNYFKILFGSTTTAIVRCCLRGGMDLDVLLSYYKNSRWLVDRLVCYYVPRCERTRKARSYEL